MLIKNNLQVDAVDDSVNIKPGKSSFSASKKPFLSRFSVKNPIQVAFPNPNRRQSHLP
jgi:hypothetical protein